MANYKLEGAKWNAAAVTWSFATSNFDNQSVLFSNIISEAAYLQDIQDAFSRWGQVTNLKFINTIDSHDVDIRLGWNYIDGVGNTLGQANYSFDSDGYFIPSTLITFDLDDFYPLETSGSNAGGHALFETVALHEIGHALGLDHYDDVPAVMNTFIDSIKNLTQSEIDGVHAIYGNPTAGSTDQLTVADVYAKPTNVTLNNLVDFDGVNLGSSESWKIKGEVDVQGDGDTEIVLFNQAIGRWATLGPDANGKIDLANHSWNGDTRVVGTYLDPLVISGDVVKGSPFDSQTRFSNDLKTDNISGVLGAGDYNSDGFQEVYFSLTDQSAALRAIMHLDGNIQYANYQNADQVAEYLTANGVDANYFEGWIV